MNSFLSKFSKEKRKQVAGISAVILMAASVPLLFENCSPTSQNAFQDAASVAAMAPFAYQASLDTLAYMSCNGQAAPNGTLFTFRGGAFTANAGLQMTPGFMNAAAQLSLNDKITALQQSKINSGAYAQMSIRSPTASANGVTFGMQAYFSSSPGAASASNMGIAPIDSGTNLQQLLNAPTSWFNSFNMNGVITPFAGTIDFTTAPAEGSNGTGLDASSVRTAVSSAGNGYLALDFTNATLDVPGTYEGALPQGSFNSLYGVGYQFTFVAGKSLNGLETITGATRVVNTVTEYNLMTNATDGRTWSCPYHIMIVRPGADAANCPVGNAAIPASVSAMLPPSQWSVNMALNCAVPKSGLCYGTNSAAVIDYNGSTSCNAAQNLCPHYVSICTKNP